MSANLCLNILFLCGVLCQGIVGTVSEKDIDKYNGESSDLLVRQKRVISLVPGEDVRQSVRDIYYIVGIREKRSGNHCPGTIVAHNIVITIVKCVQSEIDKYQVFSATSRTVYSRRSNIHNIIDKRTYHGVHPFRPRDGVALIVVYPPFSTPGAQSIAFFQGDLHPGTLVTVSGWGCDSIGNLHTQHSDYLRSITVPIISVQHCADIYRRIFAINEADICTLDQHQQRYCTVKDGGAPLVIKVHEVPYLVGIHLWNGGVSGRPNPDVYINLQDHWYKSWLTENIHSLTFIHR